jgi:hypothetical protein
MNAKRFLIIWAVLTAVVAVGALVWVSNHQSAYAGSEPPADWSFSPKANSANRCQGLPDGGYGLDENGCPRVTPEPLNEDWDGDGVPNFMDACAYYGSEGYGVDMVGCPNPAPSEG